MALVPNPVMETLETDCDPGCLGFYFELGEENADLANCPGFHRDSFFAGN
jgi:hypothetical protein